MSDVDAAPWLFAKTGLANGSVIGEEVGGFGIEIDSVTPESPPGTTVLARIPEHELVAFFEGHGYEPLLVTGGFDDEDHAAVHRRFSATLDDALDRIAQIQHAARAEGAQGRPRWPMTYRGISTAARSKHDVPVRSIEHGCSPPATRGPARS